jgi:hypothetical protein
VLWEWCKGDNQRWKIVPWCKHLLSISLNQHYTCSCRVSTYTLYTDRQRSLPFPVAESATSCTCPFSPHSVENKQGLRLRSMSACHSRPGLFFRDVVSCRARWLIFVVWCDRWLDPCTCFVSLSPVYVSESCTEFVVSFCF